MASVEDDFFEVAPIAMAVVDLSNGHLINVNQELLHLVDFDKSNLGRQNCLDYFEDNFKRTRFVKVANHSTEQIKGNLDLLDKNGNKRTLTIKGRSINEGSDLLCTIEDSTQDLYTIENLRGKVVEGQKEIDKLLNYNRVVFHNLKGHAINFELMFDFLENAEDQNEVKKTLDVLRYSTKSLSENILDLKKMVNIRNGAKTEKKNVLY